MTFSQDSLITATVNISVIDAMPERRNVTRVDYTWRSPNPDNIVVVGQLPLFNLTFAGILSSSFLLGMCVYMCMYAFRCCGTVTAFQFDFCRYFTIMLAAGHVCVCICMYACIYIAHACIYIALLQVFYDFACSWACVCIYMYVCMYLLCVCVCVCAYTYLCVSACIYIHTYQHKYNHVYMYIHTCKHEYMHTSSTCILIVKLSSRPMYTHTYIHMHTHCKALISTDTLIRTHTHTCIQAAL